MGTISSYRNVLVVLVLGNLIAWGSVIHAFVRFYQTEGTLFKIYDCVYPNPVTTACFYGALGFLVFFIWVFSVKKMSNQKRVPHLKWMVWGLVGAVVFGFSNVAYEFYYYYGAVDSQTVGCSAGTDATPWESPCLYGSVLYITALVMVDHLMKKEKNMQITN